MLFNGKIVVCTVLLLQTTNAISQGCSSNLRRVQTQVAIKETDPNGTLILQFENSFTKIDWSASTNGSNKDVISSYLQDEVDDRYFRLLVAKKIDLEFMATELNMVIDDNGLKINIILRCLESSGEPSQMTVNLEVTPVNEFFPAFIRAPYEITVKENTPVGTTVFSFQDRVVDMDVGKHVFVFTISPYMITEFDGRELFEINRQTGAVEIATEIDFERLPRLGRNYYFLNVTVKDEGGFAQSTSVKVIVEDVNDLGIEWIDRGCFQTCAEINTTYYAETNESYVGIIDLYPVPLRARDLDTIQERVLYFLTSDNVGEYFSINRYTGEIFKTAEFKNDSFSSRVDLEVFVREESNANHNLTAHITVSIPERFPTTGSL